MNRQQKLFVYFYTNPKLPKTFLNGSGAYQETYPRSEHPDSHCQRLLKNPKIKEVIDSKLKALTSVTCEDITLRLEQLYNATTKENTKLKTLELMARLHKLLKDNEISNNTTIIGNLQQLKERERSVNNSVDKRIP